MDGEPEPPTGQDPRHGEPIKSPDELIDNDRISDEQDPRNSNEKEGATEPTDLKEPDGSESKPESKPETQSKDEKENPDEEPKTQLESKAGPIDSSAPSPESSHTTSTGPPTRVDSETKSPELPRNYTLSKLNLELPLSPGESITCIASHEANLYIGTSNGQILHMYLFEDAVDYMLILQLSVAESAVAKILLLPETDVCLVLCNRVLSAYSLPELSPLRVGKIKDCHDVSVLSLGKSKNTSEKKNHDKVLVFSSTKIRVVQFLKDSVKLMRDINYPDAVQGVSSANGTSANYSNICLVANSSNYDVVDMQQTRRIPLFEYNPASESGIRPYIVPFVAEDTEKPHEEYMLPVCSDPQNSMAMFVDAAGVVTRGTLAWMDTGYPTGGLAVEWPLAIGLFENNGVSLVFTSLESLTVEKSVPSSDLVPDAPLTLQSVETGVKVVDSALSAHLKSVSPFSESAPFSVNSFLHSRVVIYSQSSIYTLSRPSMLATKIESTIEKSSPDDLEQSLAFFKSQPGRFANSMHIVLLILSNKAADAKKIVETQHEQSIKIDPRLLLVFFGDSGNNADPLWQQFTVEACFMQLLELHPRNTDQDSISWLIREVHAHSSDYETIIGTAFRKWMYTRVYQSSSEFLSLVAQEAEIWQGQSSVNDEVMVFLEHHHYVFVQLKIFMLKQEVGNPFDNWALKIIDLCLQLLAGKTKNNENDSVENSGHTYNVGDETFDLLSITFKQLSGVEDEETYTKKLLQVLQTCPEDGAKFLKTNRGTRFKNTHTHLLRELTKSTEHRATFSSLKLEYLEHTFIDKLETEKAIDLGMAKELLDEHLQHLASEDEQVGSENLNILFSTFKVENDLKDPHWPKISWIDFLQVNHRKTDCAEYLKSYLKAYELMVILQLKKIAIDSQIKPQNDAFVYLEKMVNPDQAFLLDIGDHSTAEWVAVHGIFPLPTKTIFIQNLRTFNIAFEPLPTIEVTERVKNLLVYYLQMEDPAARNFSAMHLLTAQGSYFVDPLETLDLLAQDTPLLYVQDYLITKLVDLEEQRMDAVMHKGLAKGDVRTNSKTLAVLDTQQAKESS